MPSPKPDRPPITCPDFAPLPDGKRCGDYLSNGACQRPDHFMCDEWLKVNPLASPGPAIAVHHQLFAPPVAISPALTAAPPGPAAPPPRPVPAPPPPPAAPSPAGIRCLTEADIASFKALGVEVCLAAEALGEVWLVPAYTGAERLELSVEHAVLLAAVGTVLPGSRVTAIRSAKKSSAGSSPP